MEEANQKLVSMETSLGEKMKAIQSLQQVTIVHFHLAKYMTSFSKQNIVASIVAMGPEGHYGQVL